MNTTPTREIPLRDIFLTVGDYLRTGLRYWWVLALLGIAIGGYQGWRAKKTHSVYVATLTFVLNEDQQAGSMGSILGQFGLGGGGGGGTSPEKIIALAKSQKLVHDLLMDSIVVEGRSDLLVNHLISAYDLVERWELKEDQRTIVHPTLPAMTEKEKSLLKRLYFFVLSEAEQILKVSSDEETGILSITASTREQDISMAVSKGLYSKLSHFYTEESTGGPRATVERLRTKADSVATALSAAEYQLARVMDTRLGALQRRDQVRQAQLDRQVQILNLTYAEVLRNLETASFALSTQTPFFQAIDEPFTPLYNDSPNWKKELFYGGLMGVFLGFVLVGGIKFYRDVMAFK